MFFKQQSAQVDDAREVEDWLLWLLPNDERPLSALFFGFQIHDSLILDSRKKSYFFTYS